MNVGLDEVEVDPVPDGLEDTAEEEGEEAGENR